MNRRFPDASRLLPLFALAVIVSYFFMLARGSLGVYFSPDDSMNLYRAWFFPLRALVRANLLFWETSTFYRPAAAAWYRTIFHFAGLDARPFHAVLLLILAANIILTWAVARRLSGSDETGLLAALLGSYHSAFVFLYFDTGFVFDVLCYFFFFSAFLVYLVFRQRGRPVGAGGTAGVLALYICALNSKEIGVTLPLFLGLYEVLYHGERLAARKGRWILAEGRVALITGGMAVAFAIGRTTGSESLALDEGYAFVFTWHRLMETSRNFLDQLFLRQPGWFTDGRVLALWLALLAAALLARSRTLLFAWLFLMLSVAPVAFLLPRGAPQYYLPWFGWVLYAATALASGTKWLAQPLPQRVRQARGAAVFAGLMLLLYPYYRAKGWSNVSSVLQEAPLNRSIAEQLHAIHRTMPRGARLFFLNDPFPADWSNMVFVVQLSYGDRTLVVDRQKKMARRPGDSELASYNYVFDYRAGHFRELHRPWLPEAVPMIFMTPAGAEVYHEGWVLVTEAHPARPGEFLITKATNLGATQPPVATGQRFPGDPPAWLAVKPEVRVNGTKAETTNEFGWPTEINIYRLDIRIPAGTARGMAKIELTAGGVAGVPAYIPVRP